MGRAARQLFRGRDPDRHRPLFTAVVALWLIKPEVPDRRRSAGLIIGFVWVIALLGIDLSSSRAYTAVTPAKGGFMRLTGRLEVKSGT